MNVTNFEARPIAAQTSRPESRKTALVGQLGERIGLIHELAELAPSEEIPDDGTERLRIDKLLRGDLVDSDIKKRHPLTNETLGPRQANTALVREQFPHGPHAAATEVIDIIGHPLAPAQLDEILHGGDKVFLRQNPLLVTDAKTEFLVDFVASYAAEIVAFGVKEKSLEHSASVLDGWWITRAELAVDILQRFFLVMRRILFERLDDRVVFLRINDLHGLVTEARQLPDRRRIEGLKGAGHRDFSIADVGDEDLGADLFLVELLAELEVFDLIKKLDDVLVCRMSESTKKRSGQKLPATLAPIEVDIEQVARVELHLDPRTAVRNDPEAVKDFAIRVDRCLKTDTR